MSNLERLYKTLETTGFIKRQNKQFVETNILERNSKLKKFNKQEKLKFCSLIGESIYQLSSKDKCDINYLITICIEAFFIFGNDQEQDVRTNANECLNKLINSKFTEYSAKIQNELLKELLKNESRFSVVSALNSLASISHLMRPSRSKNFFVSLIPAIIKLSEQTEDELIQECLNQNIDTLMSNFIKFGTDAEITSLLNAFIKNLYLDNNSCKRTAAVCLTSICENSKKKFDMIFWLLNELFNQLLDIQDKDRNTYLIGTFLSLRTIIPLFQSYAFQNQQDVNSDLSLNLEDKEIIGIQVNAIKKSLLLFYLIFLKELRTNDDGQLINVLLEFLQILLKSLPKVFQLLFNLSLNDKFGSLTDDEFNDERQRKISDEFFSLTKIEDEYFIDHSSTYLEYTLKVICVKFLLNNDVNNKLKADSQVRVLVKSLALNSLSKLIELKPNCLKMEIYKDIKVLDVLGYSNHLDSNLTGHSSLIVGSFIKSKLVLHLLNSQNLKEDEKLILKLFFKHLYLSLDNKSSVHLKLVLNAIKSCINEILNSNSILNLIIIDLLRKLVTFYNHPYWLIKVELLELFSSLNYKSICYIERSMSNKFAIDSNIQLLILNNVFYNLLVDSDYRVRNSTIKNLIKLIPNLYFNNYTDSRNDEILSFSKNKLLNQNFKHSRSFSFNLNSEQYKKMNLFPSDNLLPNSFGFVFPFSEYINAKDDFISTEFNDIGLNLKTVINHLVSNLLEKIENKLTITGILEALAELTDAFPTTKFTDSWNINKSTKLIEFLFSYLTTTQNAILDLSLHSLFLKLITNLICGCAYNELKEYSIFRAKSRNSIFERSFQSETILSKTVMSNSAISNSVSIAQKAESDQMETCSMMSSATTRLNTNLILANIEQSWGQLGYLNPDLRVVLKNITTYFIRLLHVYSSVFRENNVETNKNFLTQVFKPNFSPLKRSNSMRASDLFERSDLFKFSDKDKQNSTRKEAQLHQHHEYTNDVNLIKLYDSIKKMYNSTMNTLDFFQIDPAKQNKLILFLNEVFYSFCKVLELGNHNYFSRLIDELVHLITPIFTVQSSNCLQFVRQLVKVLFGTNFSSIYEFEYPNENQSDPNELEHLSYSSFINETNPDQLNQTNINLTSDLYSICLSNNYEKIKEKLMSLNENNNSSTIANKSRCDLEKEYYNVFYHHKLFDKRMKSVLSHNYTDFINETAITNYLQTIQPLLIDSKKNYTCTSDLNLHCSTLNLLNELVKVHVNYSSLDEDQTFFSFLSKQFEFIENEQISSDRLIKAIFSFLITLSYDKSSYSLLNYPKIINMIGNLWASDANFDINVFPALNLIVEDLFLTRTISNSEDLKELETQKEFIINLLIKSAHLPKIIYLLNIILIEYKLEGEEKVKKLSRQITDQLLQNLVKGCVNFVTIEDVNIVMKLFLSVSQVVFRPVDFVLNGIFSLFDDNLLNNQTSFLKFYSHKLVLFNVLIGNSKEDIILNRLDELKVNLVYLNIQSKANSKVEDNLFYTLPVFCRLKTIDKSINQDSKNILSKYLIKLVLLALEQLDENEQMLCSETNFKFKEFLNQLLNQLLMNIYFIVKEGLFPKLTRCLKDNLETSDLERINNYMRSLSVNHPNLIIQWFNVLIEVFGKLDQNLNEQILKIESIDDLSNRFEKSLSLDLNEEMPINEQKQSSFLFKLIKSNTINGNKQIDNHLYSPVLELIRRNDYLIRFNYLVQNSNYLKNDDWLNEKNVIFFIQHNKQESIVKIFNLISLDADLSLKFIRIMNSLKFEKLNELNQLNPILTVERLLIFCSLLHKKSTKYLIDYLLTNLYSDPNFIHLPSLRKMILQITNKKLKCLSFIQSTIDERLDEKQISRFIQILNTSNRCGLTKVIHETVDCLTDYLNALDLLIESDKVAENKLPETFDPLLNNLDDSIKNFELDKFLNEDQVDREKFDCINNLKFEKEGTQELKCQLSGNVDNNQSLTETYQPNQNWLLSVLLDNPLFNKSYELFAVLNSKFSVNELLSMLEHEEFRKESRNIKFATNALEHINEVLELNLNYDNNPHSSFQLLKSSKFSLVLSIRLLVIRLFNNVLKEFNLDSKAKYFSYLNAEELFFKEELENFEMLNKLFNDKKNRERLIKFSNLLSIFYQHLDLISKFDQLRKRCILNNQQDVLKNEENVDKLIKLDNLDYSLLLRVLMLYSELIQFEIKECDNSYSNDCIMVIRSFAKSDFLMNMISTYDYNSMQFTLIQSLYSYFKKKFNLFSLDNLTNCTPKHFQNHQHPDYHYLDVNDPVDDHNLKFKHSHNACLKMSEIMNFILKQSTELIYKDDHLLQNRKLYSDQELDNLVFITLVLARLPLINRFILVPSQIWKDDNPPKLVALKTPACPKGKEKTEQFNYYEADTFCSTLPSEQLFDPDTLQTFINLVNLVGFTSRMQFEEIYMSLLGVIYLNHDQTKSQSTEDLFIEEVNEKANLIVLAIKGITSILMQCNQREIGFPIKNLKNRTNRLVDSQNDEQIRRKAFLNTKYGSKLLNLNRHIDQPSNLKFAGLDNDLNENYFENLILGELNYNYLNLVQFTEHFYENRYGLYSTEFMKKKFGLVKDLGELNSINESSSSSSSSTPVHQLSRSDSLVPGGKKEIITFKMYKNKDNISVHNMMEIDVNSCIHTLLDLYWNIVKSHIAVQEEVLKSIIKISDLFFDINQFNKNIDLFFDLFKTAWSQEDEISMQYLILGICKFYTIAHDTFQNDNVKFEKYKKSIEISLKSQFFSTRINCLVGLNYILQDKLNAINKGRPSQSKDNLILLVLKDYVLKHLFDKDLNKNVEHAILVWNSTFLLVDYYVEEFDESDFNQKLFRQVLISLNECDNIQIYTVISNGVQRLLVGEFFRIRECNKIVRICIDKLKNRPFYDFQTVSSFFILTTSIYVFGLLPSASEQINLEEEMLNLENINILFSCLKKLDCNQNFFRLIVNSLPDILTDFILDDNSLLNKVINEFLLNQKNNVEFFAIILHKVITKLQKQSKQTLIHDWISMSIKNFSQVKYVLSSVFAILISASTNTYIRSLFGNIIENYGRLKNKELLKTVINSYKEELNQENLKQFELEIENLDKFMDSSS